MPLLQAMASGVIARHEAIQWTDNKQIAKHVIGRSVATWQSRHVHHPGLPRLTARNCRPPSRHWW
ncbi:MAG: hypothetical protein LBF85_01425 [Tannerella sp.]|nr:hypothetical protein [Tannerella sp.]